MFTNLNLFSVKYLILVGLVLLSILTYTQADLSVPTVQLCLCILSMLLGVCASLAVFNHKSTPRYVYLIIGLIAFIVYTFVVCYGVRPNSTSPTKSTITFVWNDDEESIPCDGSLITLEMTDEDTVYIGPYDSTAKTN